MTQRALTRTVLVSLGGVQVLYGLYALLAPRSFYDDFPVGRHWVSAYPAYSEHLVRDVGGLFLGTAVMLLFAACWLSRPLLIAALVSWLCFSIPHTIYHAFNASDLKTTDAVGELISLAATVVLPLWLLTSVTRGLRTPPGASPGTP
jgi:hypothetical protein